MNIHELSTYNLADAVKFHRRLNPRIWGRDEHLLPEVREKLLTIAADFQEFLGVDDLNVEDITISGSNAAYSYTKNSDIDLHLVVEMPADPVYQELFTAKKYQYNSEHNIKIGGAEVELYVQPADQAHHSQGIYSVKNGEWIQVPQRKRAQIDDTCVRDKTADLDARIHAAVKSKDTEQISTLWTKIKTMRQAGLEQHGEFGCENISFKLLRNRGCIKLLKDALTAGQDRELSLREAPAKPFRYGYGTEVDEASLADMRAAFAATDAPRKQEVFHSPDEYNKTMKQRQAADDERQEKIAKISRGTAKSWPMGVKEGHQGQPYSSEDGVAASTCMYLNEDDENETKVYDFIHHVTTELGIDPLPKIVLHTDPKWSTHNHSFGRYDPDTHTLNVSMPNRHILDVLRTVAHELVHCSQNQQHGHLPDDAGETGSDWENDANARSGIIMRDWANTHPEDFEQAPLEEGASGYIPKNKKEAAQPQYAMALSVDIKPGQTGKEANKLALHTGRNGEPGLLMKTVNLRESTGDRPGDPTSNREFVSNKYLVKFTPTEMLIYKGGELVYRRSGDYANLQRSDVYAAKSMTSRLWTNDQKGLVPNLEFAGAEKNLLDQYRKFEELKYSAPLHSPERTKYDRKSLQITRQLKDLRKNQGEWKPKAEAPPVSMTESADDYQIHNTEKLDRVLAKCCAMIERGQQTDPERYGQVAACIIDPDHNYVYGINLPGANGTRRHAERVAIDKYRKTHGDIPAGSIVVTTLSPCNSPMDERAGESCKDLLNSVGIHKVYCGYIDPTQHDDDNADFTVGLTQNDALWESCKAFADTFLHEDDLEEGWKSALAGVAAAGAMAFTPAPANSTAAPAVGPTAQPAAVQQAPMAGPQGALSQAAQAAGIKGTELAQFMAQCEHESGNFTHLEELGGKNYLAKYDPTVNPAKAKALGNTKAGDGAKYKGRGFIQITGKANYASAGQALGMDLVNNPELAAKPDVAAKIAVWYWQNRVTPYVQNFADTRSVTKRINPGLQGLQDREENFKDYQQQTATVAAPPARVAAAPQAQPGPAA